MGKTIYLSTKEIQILGHLIHWIELDDFYELNKDEYTLEEINKLLDKINNTGEMTNGK